MSYEYRIVLKQLECRGLGRRKVRCRTTCLTQCLLRRVARTRSSRTSRRPTGQESTASVRLSSAATAACPRSAIETPDAIATGCALNPASTLQVPPPSSIAFTQSLPRVVRSPQGQLRPPPTRTLARGVRLISRTHACPWANRGSGDQQERNRLCAPYQVWCCCAVTVGVSSEDASPIESARVLKLADNDDRVYPDFGCGRSDPSFRMRGQRTKGTGSTHLAARASAGLSCPSVCTSGSSMTGPSSTCPITHFRQPIYDNHMNCIMQG